MGNSREQEKNSDYTRTKPLAEEKGKYDPGRTAKGQRISP